MLKSLILLIAAALPFILGYPRNGNIVPNDNMKICENKTDQEITFVYQTNFELNTDGCAIMKNNTPYNYFLQLKAKTGIYNDGLPTKISLRKGKDGVWESIAEGLLYNLPIEGSGNSTVYIGETETLSKSIYEKWEFLIGDEINYSCYFWCYEYLLQSDSDTETKYGLINNSFKSAIPLDSKLFGGNF